MSSYQETREEKEIWCAPQIQQFNFGSSLPQEGHWFISKRGRQQFNGEYQSLYLGEDGKWYSIMYKGKGTYFKTLQEAINVLCEFEIDVNNED